MFLLVRIWNIWKFQSFSLMSKKGKWSLRWAQKCFSDTLHISRRVRELLSIHNIGQRLFAKYILGLSQGTVSELLSKPKPWDKLTEKGRDSYRKMHAWACDDNAIMLLKSLIPKKGKIHKNKFQLLVFQKIIRLLDLESVILDILKRFAFNYLRCLT